MSTVSSTQITRYIEEGYCLIPNLIPQNSIYWKIAPELDCNCWIPLTSVGIDASALAIMPKTHQSWQLVEHESYYDDPPFGHIDNDVFTPSPISGRTKVAQHENRSD